MYQVHVHFFASEKHILSLILVETMRRFFIKTVKLLDLLELLDFCVTAYLSN